MIVKCGVNGETLVDSRTSVCHHCGMPVCELHGWVVASDDAFADSAEAPTPLPDDPAPPVPATPPDDPAPPVPGTPPVMAAVAAGAAATAPGPVGSVLRITNRPLPAMHCRDCADKFHAGAVKRHGWTEHRPPAATGYARPAGRP